MERSAARSTNFTSKITAACVLLFFSAISGTAINADEESGSSEEEEPIETQIAAQEDFVTEMALEVLELDSITEQEETFPPPETTIIADDVTTQTTVSELATEKITVTKINEPSPETATNADEEENAETTLILESATTEGDSETTTTSEPDETVSTEAVEVLSRIEKGVHGESDKIINGELAEEGSYTSVVSLQHVNNSQPFCGGTILNREFVLTAAHCIFGKDGESLIDFKVVSSNIDLKLETRTYLPVTVIVHALYNKSIFLGYDIALVKVEPQFVLADGESAVRLPRQNEETPAGTVATVVGWGRTDQRFTSDRVMRTLAESVIDNGECEERLRFHPAVYEFHLCAQPQPNTGFCRGDSGGPVFVGSKQVGVVSWYKGNCSHEEPLPNVFTRVAYFADWIHEKIDEEANLFE